VIFSDHPASQDHSGGPKKKIGPRVAIRSVFKKDTTDSMAEIRRRIDVDSINKFSAVRAGSDTSKSKNSHPVSGKPAPERPSEAGGKISLGNLHLNFGLQWILNLPVYGTKNYFTGTNGRNQAYNMLIPALWVGNSWQDKHEIMLRVRPVLEYFAGNKVLTDSTGRGGPSDSSLVRKTMTLIKTSGVAAGLQYNYNIDDQWSVGAGLEYHLQFSALVDQRTIRLPTGALLSESTASIKRSSPDWQYLKSSFIAGWFELAFQLHKFQTGAEIMMPVSNPAASPGKEIRSLNGQLFLRWRFK
jgi:hypothetical protein